MNENDQIICRYYEIGVILLQYTRSFVCICALMARGTIYHLRQIK